MGPKRKTLAERTYRANVFSDGLVSHIEGLEDTNLMPQNTDFEQIASINQQEKGKGSSLFIREKNPE